MLQKLSLFARREFEFEYNYFVEKSYILHGRMSNLDFNYSILVPWIEKVLHLVATNQMFGAYSFFKRKMLEVSEFYWPDNTDQIVLIGRINMEV